MCFQEARKLVSSDGDKTYITPLPKPQTQLSKELEDPPPPPPPGPTSRSISQGEGEGGREGGREREEGRESEGLYLYHCVEGDVAQTAADATGDQQTESKDLTTGTNGGGGGGGGNEQQNETERDNAAPAAPPQNIPQKEEATKSTQEIEEKVTKRRQLSPFVQTAAYLLDVHAAKVSLSDPLLIYSSSPLVC